MLHWLDVGLLTLVAGPTFSIRAREGNWRSPIPAPGLWDSKVVPQALKVREDIHLHGSMQPSARAELLVLRLSMVLGNRYVNVVSVANTPGSDPTTFLNIFRAIVS
ncbi:hypothetical protein KC344_g155 [Hortaea werneckii]|nr:hypothetical protein KC344_g155 [Hortaea werneckii]